MSQTLPTYFPLLFSPEKQNPLGMFPKQKIKPNFCGDWGKFGPTLGIPTADAGALAITGTSGFLHSC